jgi:hypothetical protein
MKKPSLITRWQLAVIICLVASAFAGCAGHERSNQEMNGGNLALNPPSFLMGPAAALLTNSDGFSAIATLELPAYAGKIRTLSGQILGQGNLLLFAPKGGDRIFVWDALKCNGYVFSELLQGYAQISSNIRVTGQTITSELNGPAIKQVNNHPGREMEVTLTSNDDATNHYSIWCAADLKGYPVRIKTMIAPERFVLNLSDVRPETLKPAVFLPPDGFTKYGSLEAMTSELAMRKANLKNRRKESTDEEIPMRAPDRR